MNVRQEQINDDVLHFPGDCLKRQFYKMISPGFSENKNSLDCLLAAGSKIGSLLFATQASINCQFNYFSYEATCVNSIRLLVNAAK